MSWLRAVQIRPCRTVNPAGSLPALEVAERQVAGLAVVAGVAAAEAERLHDQAQPAGLRRGNRPGRFRGRARAGTRRRSDCRPRRPSARWKWPFDGRRRQPARHQQRRVVEIERRAPRAAPARPSRESRTARRSVPARAARTAPGRWRRRRCDPTPTDPACTRAAGTGAAGDTSGRRAEDRSSDTWPACAGRPSTRAHRSRRRSSVRLDLGEPAVLVAPLAVASRRHRERPADRGGGGPIEDCGPRDGIDRCRRFELRGRARVSSAVRMRSDLLRREHEHRRVVGVVHVVHEHVAVRAVVAGDDRERSACRSSGRRSWACRPPCRSRCSPACRPRCGAG